MINIKNNKKAMEISLNTIIIAIICLIVLFVIIGIFTGQISNIASKFNKQTDQAGKAGDDAFSKLNLITCEEGQKECRIRDIYICKGNNWELDQKCDNGCENNACK